MKTFIAVLTTLTLTGCGAYGEPLLLARMFDSNDPCQRNPSISFCGAASGPVVYKRDFRTGNITATYSKY
jgi:hypothetical protein